jgi:hypothetical protein
MTTAAKRIKTTAAVFELPQRLGILQYVEYEPPPREWCTEDGCLYEGRTVEDCVRQILEDYRRELEKMKEPPKPALVVKTDPVEELLREWPELEAFGVEWVKAWAPHSKERLMEIAKVMRRYPWMVEVVRQRPVSHPHPYLVEVYVARDGSEVCLSLNQLRTFCARNGAVKETKLELAFSRYEAYEEKIREVYRPKGLLAFSTAAREYVRLL